jgi:alditol oxidase
VSTTNWAGNYTYRAKQIHRPTRIEQVQEIVGRASKVHVLGSRHGFNSIADSDELISLADMPEDITLDRQASTVSCSPGSTYGALAQTMEQHGLALHNLASLPHISVAGAITTATHGSGDRNRNLSTAVAGLELVRSNGEILRIRRGDADFPGLVVSLGAVGALTRVTLDVEPSYEVAQRVFENLAWNALFDHFDEVTSSGYSVSLFTDWGDSIDQVWIKTRTTDSPAFTDGELFGAKAAQTDRHPIPGMDPINCTPQLGKPGAWWECVPHFRIGFTPGVGQELQSEYLVPRRHGLSAIEAVRRMAQRIRPLLQSAEIRTIAGDDLWMSPEYGRDTVGIHFTWIPDQPAVEELLVDLESALAPFQARPHWSKVFVARSDAISSLYERLPDFLHLVERLDPRGAFRNDWFEAHIASDLTEMRVR